MVMWDRGRGLGGNSSEKMLQALGLRGDSLAQAIATNLDYLDSISGMLDALGAAYGNKESVHRQIVDLDRMISSVLEGVLTNNGTVVDALSIDGPQVGMMSQRLFKQMALQMYRTQINQTLASLKQLLDRRAMLLEQLLRDSPDGAASPPR